MAQGDPFPSLVDNNLELMALEPRGCSKCLETILSMKYIDSREESLETGVKVVKTFSISSTATFTFIPFPSVSPPFYSGLEFNKTIPSSQCLSTKNFTFSYVFIHFHVHNLSHFPPCDGVRCGDESGNDSPATLNFPRNSPRVLFPFSTFTQQPKKKNLHLLPV